ncbi:ficolin-1-like [Mixophyes fleayi]|uniref:ficolin-1-like n=1 Tax=Mixophyes fleayi TaxID=3061075 RepID=UPI003F4E0CBC
MIQTLTLLWMVTMLSNAKDDVKIVGTEGSDQLPILRGSPGISGTPGPKGEAGKPGDIGDCGPLGTYGNLGEPGINGQQGPLGETGKTGQPGQKGDPAKGQKGTKGDSCSPDSQRPKNCKELLKTNSLSSRYTIYPDGKKPLRVLCDMDTDGAGWTVFQRRWDGSVDFFRDWKSYKTGFGSLMTEFWLGNDNLHMLTSSGTWELRVDVQHYNTTKQFAKYGSFKILGEAEKYKLILGDFKDGNSGDTMNYHNDMKFTTKDQDNDERETSNCAESYKGGWWYKRCYDANLNGLYHSQNETSDLGINLNTNNGWECSYKYTEMKIRPV